MPTNRTGSILDLFMSDVPNFCNVQECFPIAILDHSHIGIVLDLSLVPLDLTLARR